MNDKDIVQLIRGTGNAARILGALNIAINGIAYIHALSINADLPQTYHFITWLFIAIAIGFFVIGRQVYAAPDHHQKNHLYQILALCILVVVLGVITKSVPIMFGLLGVFTFNTLKRLKKHGPISNLSEVLEEIKNPPTVLSATDKKLYKKEIRTNTFKIFAVVIAGVLILFTIFAVLVLTEPKDGEPGIHTTDPSAA